MLLGLRDREVLGKFRHSYVLTRIGLMVSFREKGDAVAIAVDDTPTLMPATLPRDLRQAASELGLDEARYLVDTYYAVQDFRKANANQTRALSVSNEPHATVAYFAEHFHNLERQVASALDSYSASQPLGQWARSHCGVGPVIAAGLLAHIDIERATTAGAVWRFAGLDPTLKWEKRQKRPYNASLKVLCWKLGDSFVKQSGRDDCFYGHLYRQRKVLELERDEQGANAKTAAETLEVKQIREPATRKVYESGHLPPGRLDLRARRWAVKLFLAHYWEEGRRQLGLEIVAPYPLAVLGHAHRIDPPTTD